MPDFPKLLVATEFPPNAAGGGGAIVRQMLKDWPVEKLFWWSCQPEKDQTFGQRVAGHTVARIPGKLYPHRRARGLKCVLLQNFWTPWAARHFHQTVADIQPEVVWIIANCWSIPPLARELPRIKAGVHISIHDYPDVSSAVTRFGSERCRRFSQLVDQMYAQATTRDTVSQQMTDDLKSRTGAAGGINRCGLEPDELAALQDLPPAAGETIRIAYAGTIIVEREFALFATALGRIRRQLPKPMTLEFLGDHSYRGRPWFDAAWMKEQGNLPPLQLTAALRQCTWGFAPMALTDDNPRYNRYSLPTKFVSYLAAGLPILALGHPDCTVVKMAVNHNVGFCFTTGEDAALAAQLLPVLSDPEPGAKFRPAIRRCAAAEFAARQMREALHNNFRQCAALFRAGS